LLNDPSAGIAAVADSNFVELIVLTDGVRNELLTNDDGAAENPSVPLKSKAQLARAAVNLMVLLK
jgi:hypothetical protein